MKAPCRKICRFFGKYSFLSNYYNCHIWVDGILYQNAEAAYQAQKMADKRRRKEFSELNGAGARHLGKYIVIRDDWNSVKYDIMREVIKEKFSQNDNLREKLINTNDSVLEFEGYDDNDEEWGKVNGEGDNYLGRILMEERARIRTEIEESNRKECYHHARRY